MRYDDPEIRRAYVAAATEAVEALAIKVSGPEYRELEQWLAELGDWSDGEPPPAPHHW